MHIELKEIDKDTLKVGDVVGVAREVNYGWVSSFRHKLIFPAQITRITPKRTKFFTDKFGEHDKREVFYECDSEAEKETFLAKAFYAIKNGIFELTELKRNDRIGRISDEDLPEVAEFEEKEKCGEWLDAIELAKIAIALQSQKHIPVKPIILDVLNGDIDYVCPLCDKEVMSDAESRNNYCGECGCKFDWSDEQ